VKIICNCGEEMSLTLYEPDQDEIYVGFDCPKCGASLYGTFKRGKEDEEDT